MKKRLMALVLVTIMLMAGVLSACSSKESDKDTKDTSKAAQEKTVQKNHSSEKKSRIKRSGTLYFLCTYVYRH